MAFQDYDHADDSISGLERDHTQSKHRVGDRSPSTARGKRNYIAAWEKELKTKKLTRALALKLLFQVYDWDENESDDEKVRKQDAFASEAAIKAAYREAAKRFHPDRRENHGSEEVAAALFKLYATAYRFLNQP